MTSLTLLTTLALSLIVLNNSVAGLESENIIGGQYVKKNEIKFQASIQIPIEHWCGGAFLAPDIILTAAHCFCDEETMVFKNRPYFVVAGTTNVSDHTYRSRVETIYLHKNFGTDRRSGYYLNDIALVKLDKGFKVGKELPIDLASLPDKNENFVGKTAVVSGFGYEKVKITGNQRNGTSSGQLKKEPVNILNWRECNPFPVRNLICGRMAQSKASHQSVCTGDSGSPLVFNKKVIGIVSIGVAACDETIRPSAYTEVSKYLDFINGVLNGKFTNDTLIKSPVGKSG